MKILFINKFLHPNGGSETYIFQLGDFLRSQGHEVEYFGMEHPERVVGNSAESYTSNMDFHEGSILSKLFYPVKTIYSSEARKKIRKVLEDFKPDVCHLNNFNYQLTPSIILEIKKWRKKNNHKCKIVFTSHDYQLVCPNHMCNNPNTGENCEKCLNGSFLNCTKGKCIHSSTAKSFIGTCEAMFWKMKGVYKYIDTFICCSHFMKSKLDTNPLFAKKTVVIHNFMQSISADKKYEKGDYVLYFGRFSREKGVATLLEVCRNLPDIPFVFAGTGPLEDEIKDIPNITNVGFKTGSDLVELVSKAKFTVYPSEWYENCPFSVIESQIYGTPVIGADIGGIPELISKGVSGDFFKSGDAADLQNKLNTLYNDKELLDSYTEGCKAVSFETPESYYDKLMNYYK